MGINILSLLLIAHWFQRKRSRYGGQKKGITGKSRSSISTPSWSLSCAKNLGHPFSGAGAPGGHGRGRVHRRGRQQAAKGHGPQKGQGRDGEVARRLSQRGGGKGCGPGAGGEDLRPLCGFAEFGFCKSHAMSFALLCYRSAFLKQYYPAEFYCALLNNQPMGFYIPEVIVGDARRHGVEVLPVDAAESLWECSPEGGGLRLGFRYVKSLGADGAEAIVDERKKGAFTSFRDFLSPGCASIRTRSGISSSSGPSTGWSAPGAASSGRSGPSIRWVWGRWTRKCPRMCPSMR